MIDRRSALLLALGGLSLLAGLAGALLLLGIGLPRPASHLAAAHGLLMTLGFLGTMIALERAVALGRRWAFLAPLLAGVAAASLATGANGLVPALLLFAAGIVLCAIYAAFDRLEAAIHIRTQAVGAVAWPVAAALLLAGRPVSEVTPWLAAFLVLVIAGERRELSRLGRLSDRARALFMVVTGVFVAGVILTLANPDAGMRLAGAGLVGLTGWLVRHDLARRTVRIAGVTRFIGLCLLIGYAWLAVAGVAWVAFGSTAGGPAYDAMLHALFLGFVISMVFGHAPVIVPAVLRVPLPYRPRFYLHLALLHGGLLLRIVGGDLLGLEALWRLGGIVNVVALLVFVGSSAASVLQERSARRALVQWKPNSVTVEADS